MKQEETILVTGAAGFIGSHLVDGMLARGHQVVGVDNLMTGKLSNLDHLSSNQNFRFIKANVNDFNDISSIFYCYMPKYVFHYAACVGVERTLSNPLQVLADVKGFDNIFNLSKSTGVQKVLFSSSSEVYGEPVHFPQNEEVTPLNSKLPYAILKNLGEVYLKSYHREFNLDYTIFRFFNTYGPRQSEDFVVTKFIKAALRNQPLTIYGDGTQTRTFCYICNNVEATLNAISNAEADNRTFNIGNPDEIRIADLANEIISVANSTSDIKQLPPLKEGDMSRRQPDVKRMQGVLTNKELLPLRKGLERTVSYFQDQMGL